MASNALDVANLDGALCGASIKQKAATGAGNALRVDSDNTTAPALLVKGSGPLLDLRAAGGTSLLSVSQAGAVTVSGYTTLEGAQTNGDFTSLGDLIIGTAGEGLKVKEGSNATMGTATMVAGTVVVETTKVTATSRIFLTVQSLGTVSAPKAIGVTARTPATSFTITSADNTDTSVVAWVIVEPAA